MNAIKLNRVIVGRCGTCGGHTVRFTRGPLCYHVTYRGVPVTGNKWRTWFHNPNVIDGMGWMRVVWMRLRWTVCLPLRVASFKRHLAKTRSI